MYMDETSKSYEVPVWVVGVWFMVDIWDLVIF